VAPETPEEAIARLSAELEAERVETARLRDQLRRGMVAGEDQRRISGDQPDAQKDEHRGAQEHRNRADGAAQDDDDHSGMRSSRL